MMNNLVINKYIFSQIFLIISLIIISCSGIYKNSPTFKIETIKVGKGPGSVEVGDFNNDGIPDIVVANSSDSSVSILLGNGNGAFKNAPGSPLFANRFPNDLTIADFNKDGNADIGIANTEASFLTVLLGNGKGNFDQAPHSPFLVHSKPHTHGIATGDFNNDGNLDLVSESWGINKVFILFGDGKGNFSGDKFFNVGNRPYQRLRSADINKDGRPDIITTNLEGENTTVLLCMGDGIMREADNSPFPAGPAPFAVAIGDVNGDSNMDLAIANAPTITSESRGQDGLTILIGNGKGSFSPMNGSPFKTGKSPSRVAIGDLNGDGIKDVVVTNYNDKSISIFYMKSTGVKKIETIKVGGHPDGIAIADLKKEGNNKIIVSNFDDDNIMIVSVE